MVTGGKLGDWEHKRRMLREYGDHSRQWSASDTALRMAATSWKSVRKSHICGTCLTKIESEPRLRIVSTSDWNGRGKCFICGRVNTSWQRHIRFEEAPLIPKGTAGPRDLKCRKYEKRGDGHCRNCGVHWNDHSRSPRE
jgi:hypothetical protein